MAKTKTKTEAIECTNDVNITGKINKIICQTDKVCIMSIDSTKKSSKGNTIHTWVTVAVFSPEIEFEVNDMVKVGGYLATDSYDKDGNKVYQLRVIADTIEVMDEIPFN